MVTGVFYAVSNSRDAKKTTPKGGFSIDAEKISLSDFLVSVESSVTQLLLYAEQLVVLGHTVRTTQ